MIGRVAVSLISLILVVGVVIGLIASVHKDDDKNAEEEKISQQRKAVTQFCATTEYSDRCIMTLNDANTSDPVELIKATILSTQNAVQLLFNLSDEMIGKAINNKDNNSKMDLEDCKDLLRFAVEDLQASLATAANSQLHTMHNHTDDMMAWLNAVVTYQQTCFDGFEDEENPFKVELQKSSEAARELSGNALSIINDLSRILKSFDVNIEPTNNRRVLKVDNDGYPSWFSAADRKLLAQSAWEPNAVVAQDGSGQYATIQEALDAYPKDLKGRYVIYVKAGIYEESVTVTKLQKNVFMYGDGLTNTIVTGNKSYAQGFNTMNTATFSAVGEGFIAQNMGFTNTAGPEGHQAVALRVQADRAAIFGCRIDGYQDTLYAHTYRQFYHAKLWPDRWRIPTYLGRPWKEYAVTVFMENIFADFIQPDGYIPFKGSFALKNCIYYEYNNTGPGAWTDNRVKWPGVKSIKKDEAHKFTVWALLRGDQWLEETGIPYDLGLKYW
ncbi:Pectinesterase [Melia azedarach]|uniref:Pectinesterase n=1 Tax=Melia azedarach TaxID=155640 RepID=A0ACC1YWQ3_MELAZ|nr:Pectinesterase [Melia azedarach]